jgi:hypothetical protein
MQSYLPARRWAHVDTRGVPAARSRLGEVHTRGWMTGERRSGGRSAEAAHGDRWSAGTARFAVVHAPPPPFSDCRRTAHGGAVERSSATIARQDPRVKPEDQACAAHPRVKPAHHTRRTRRLYTQAGSGQRSPSAKRSRRMALTSIDGLSPATISASTFPTTGPSCRP